MSATFTETPPTPTTFANMTAAQFASRLANRIPNSWTGQGSLQSGIAWSLLNAIGQQIATVYVEVQYALNAQRIQTETSPELDLASKDFFGDLLPRPPGMTDAAFSALITANLLKRGATRIAISNAVKALTGAAPRMIEPWNPGDVGCRDNLISYRDIDTPSNPMRNTSAYLAFNGFIEAVLPTFPVLGNNPLLTRDATGYRDANEYRLQLQNVGEAQIYAAVQATKAWGTNVWLRFGTSPGNNNGLVPSVYLTDNAGMLVQDNLGGYLTSA